MGAFVKELSNQVLENKIDFSVNSMKDVPTELPDELCIAAVPKRANLRDILISNFNIEELPYNAIIGTSSMRRKALLLHLRPDLKIKNLIHRVKNAGEKPEEIILATNPTSEGDTTAFYISKLLNPYKIKMTRLAYGIPVGANIDYTDVVTLARSFMDRKIFEI